MSSLFDDLKQGLEEAIAYEQGNGKAECGRTHPTGPAFRLLDILSAEDLDQTEFVIAK